MDRPKKEKHPNWREQQMHDGIFGCKWRCEFPTYRDMTPEEWCQLADDIRREFKDAVKVEIRVEWGNGRGVTYLHDESEPEDSKEE